ncbi:MAG: 16S rRNA (guanine(527)-N(7))-methyltransferase RsmG [Bacteroidia bacterium]|nr:16S rRNA (guanine(527)-N(7))-methyltransferase RsmG [Bacteroidia bacterium]NNJ55360.1 16S rRNA (guanine(527)-N(7))-methyltransferase RsmG [Bacteroidia bacterium]
MELIKKYFEDLSDLQLERLTALKNLYEDWNSKINVISRKDMDSFYCNHVLHSLSLAKLDEIKKTDKVLDIGTGGGFPGIPLAIFYPETRFTLVDSIRKKTTVVRAVKDALNLNNVTVINDRFENVEDNYNIIVSRAVAPALKLIQYTKKASSKSPKYLFIKGGDLSEEKQAVLKNYKGAQWNELELNSVFAEPFFETKKVVTLDFIKGNT